MCALASVSVCVWCVCVRVCVCVCMSVCVCVCVCTVCLLSVSISAYLLPVWALGCRVRGSGQVLGRSPGTPGHEVPGRLVGYMPQVALPHFALRTLIPNADAVCVCLTGTGTL